MRHGRFHLIDGGLLRRLMEAPAQGGQRHTVRSLALAAGVGKSAIQAMIQGRQSVNEGTADRIAAAVDARRGWLFLPTSFMFANANDEEGKQT